MKKATLVKSLVALGLVGLLSAGAVFAKTSTSTLPANFWDTVAQLVAGSLVAKIEAPAVSPDVGDSGALLGSTQTSATYATAASVSNQGGLYLWDTDNSSGLEVAGPAHFEGPVTMLATTTISGYLANSENTTLATFNPASTTLCSIQNTSGFDRVITSALIDVTAGTSANTVNSQWAGSVTPARALAGAVNATSTLFKQTFIASSSFGISYGGPVPGSYYVTSSPALINGVGIPTTTPVMWYNGWWANVTSTAITSSTGDCQLGWNNL